MSDIAAVMEKAGLRVSGRPAVAVIAEVGFLGALLASGQALLRHLAVAAVLAQKVLPA